MTDFEVLANSPIGEDCIIDGVAGRCIFDIDGGEYEESVPTLRIASTTLITMASTVWVRGRTYGVVSMITDHWGENKVILGDAL